jgi:hypothetical protein
MDIRWEFQGRGPFADPRPTDGAYISKQPPNITDIKAPDMSTTLENQIPQQHDLSHDTLMGLQELDQELNSHLAIFESPNPGRESSTPGAISISTFDDSLHNFEQTPHTIIVDSPGTSYSRKYQPEARPVESRARPAERKYIANDAHQYVFFPCHD